MKRVRKWLLGITIGAVILVPVLMAGGWVVTDTVIHATSGQAFCTVCHSMQPFAAAYEQDTHGGRNAAGVTAACVDCHLPHEGSARYLAAKVQTGIRDVWAELLSLVREPDWIGKLEHRAEYVYDSGCLSCHTRLEDVSTENQTQVFAHRTYFQGGSNMQCVTCHAHVGHKDLLSVLTKANADAEIGTAEADATSR